MLKLFLLRHAKSRSKYLELDDFERPIKDKGVKDISVMGGIYKKHYNRVPDIIISSPARRALETAQLFASAIGYQLDKIILQQEIYEGTPQKLLRVIRNINDNYGNVVMVGHNPGFTELAGYIVDGVNIDNISTCGLVGIEFDVKSWGKIEEKPGRLFCFEYPKKY